MKLWLDLETRSETPIAHGTYRYAADAEVTLFAYAVDDGPVFVWDLTADPDIPFELEDALENCDEVWAHNTMFDRNVLRLGKRKLLCPPLHKWRDTMVQALSHSLPGKLDTLGQVLKLPADKAKDKRGRDLVMLFCKPRPKNSKLRWATRITHPKEWAEFITYAGRDIEAMRASHKLMPMWNYNAQGKPGSAGVREMALWHLDQQINDRGMFIDTDLVRGALLAVADAQRDLADQTKVMTYGLVSSTTKRDALLDHILEYYGVPMPDLQMATVERRLQDPDLPPVLKDLLVNRLQASTSSTSKYTSLNKGISTDGRLRGTKQFNGANRTGRWAGRLFQPDNLPRPNIPYWEIEVGINAIKAGSADLVFDNVMRVASNAIRGCIAAPKSKKLCISDLSNIEGRVLAWLAGEQWKLDAFQAFDDGDGFDNYKLAYAKAFGINPADVTKDQRQIGKVMELMLGYAGGVGAFLTGAASYNFDIEDLADRAYDTIPEHILAEANGFYEWILKQKGNTFGISRKAFVVCDSLKRMWREAHPATGRLWKGLEAACVEAVLKPGVTLTRGTYFERDEEITVLLPFKVRKEGFYLRVVLPSGRALCYPGPRVGNNGQLTYMGNNQYTRQWSKIKTYGGKLVENCIAAGTPVLTDAGWLAIEIVTTAQRVWDGEEWVNHKGLSFRGKQFTLSAFGVNMTPEHKVLTTKGWRHASSLEGHQRAPCRLPDGHEVLGQQRAQIPVGVQMRLREQSADGVERVHQAAKAGYLGLLRVPAQRIREYETDKARHGATPSIRGVPQHDRQMPLAFAPVMAQLWRQGHHCVRALAAKFRELLGGYGSDVPERHDDRAHEELEGLQQDQLPLAQHEAPVKQQAHKRVRENTDRSHDDFSGSRALRHREVDTGLEAESGLVGEKSAHRVYDLIDCGPRHRFVVRDPDGSPLIVHNCTQAVARDVLAHNMPAMEEAGYEIVLTVHDEAVTETPDTDDYSSDVLSEILATNPPWAVGLPLAAAGFETYAYKKED
jgi:DNA polymerase